MTFSVYTLSDPRTGHVRYVGFTRVQLALRLRYHIKDKRNARKRAWIASVRRDGHRPTIEPLESFSVRRSALDAEAEWISMLRSAAALALLSKLDDDEADGA